jgi:hypothetical protein
MSIDTKQINRLVQQKLFSKQQTLIDMMKDISLHSIIDIARRETNKDQIRNQNKILKCTILCK